MYAGQQKHRPHLTCSSWWLTFHSWFLPSTRRFSTTHTLWPLSCNIKSGNDMMHLWSLHLQHFNHTTHLNYHKAATVAVAVLVAQMWRLRL